ncbi:MAG: magnesium/cobalt transporter CorA [Crocinitomicaceae bacterium]|nr:magnesium/cobalt transporter CorA [Crocinitomicaceae bacterium]MBP6033135.1 magnesium/cobalt transporter CorA [Crocinitomicaceae bacterium]
MGNIQLYKYNATFYSVKQESSSYFADEFLESELDSDHVAWLNFHGIEDTESIEQLCHKLGIDKLTIESIHKQVRRPKVEEYSKYMSFHVMSALPKELGNPFLHQDQISFLMGENYLISFQDKPSDHFPDVRDRIEKGRGKIRAKGSDFLMFRMLEAIIDNYFEVLEEISSQIEAIDTQLHLTQDKSILASIELEKRKLIELRKIAQPMRDVTNQLENSESPFIQSSNRHYFRSLRSSCMSVLEEIDANKQILEGMANLYYAAQGQRMNEIMRVLTVVSSIFIPLTFIVGVYGMNFEHMPELKYTYGYYSVIAFMFALAIGLVALFIKRGWIKK